MIIKIIELYFKDILLLVIFNYFAVTKLLNYGKNRKNFKKKRDLKNCVQQIVNDIRINI